MRFGDGNTMVLCVEESAVLTLVVGASRWSNGFSDRLKTVLS